MNKKELIGCIGGILILISACFGTYFWIDKRYAHASDMVKAMEVIQKIGTRLDYKIANDQLKSVEQRINTIEDGYCPNKSVPCDESKMPELIRNNYRELKAEREELKGELKILQEKKQK